MLCFHFSTFFSFLKICVCTRHIRLFRIFFFLSKDGSHAAEVHLTNVSLFPLPLIEVYKRVHFFRALYFISTFFGGSATPQTHNVVVVGVCSVETCRNKQMYSVVEFILGCLH